MKYWFCISAIFLLSACGNDAQVSSGEGTKEQLAQVTGKVAVRPIEVLGLSLREAKLEQLTAAIEASGGVFSKRSEGYVEYVADKILNDENVYIAAWALPNGAIAEVRYKFRNDIWGRTSPSEKMQKTLDAMKAKYGNPTSQTNVAIDQVAFVATWERGAGFSIKLFSAENDGEWGNYPLLGYVNAKAGDEWNLLAKARAVEKRANEAAKMGKKL